MRKLPSMFTGWFLVAFALPVLILSASTFGMGMHDPIYSQTEIQAMLDAPKWIATAEWDRAEGELPAVRQTDKKERAIKLEALPTDPDSGLSFLVELRASLLTSAFSITLQGQIKPRGWQPLCRYDMHANYHPNRPFCPGPKQVKAGVLHRHVYNETAYRKLGPVSWHACAEPLGLPNGGSVRDRQTVLKQAFLEYLRIELVSPKEARDWWEFGQRK